MGVGSNVDAFSTRAVNMKKLQNNKRLNGGGAGAIASASSRLSVYDGQEFAGYLLPIGETGFRAFNSDDCPIGTYPTLKTAMRAIPAKVSGHG